MTEQRNLILAIVLSLLIMLGFQYLLPSKDQQPQPQQQTTAPSTPATTAVQTPAALPAAAPVDRAGAIANAPRVRISTPNLHGSIALTGGRIDDLTLVKYRETTDPQSPEITLLSPPGAPHPYYAEFGWVAADGKAAVPGPDTQWQQQGSGELTPTSPMVLTWDNGQGLRFTRTYAVDENYLFSVTQKVENTGTAPVALHPYGVIARTGKPKTGGYSILHEGPLGVLGGSLEEHKYDDLDKEGQIKKDKSQGGWIGITDKYWLTSLVPDQGSQFSGRFLHRRDDTVDKYQVDYLADARTVAPGQAIEVTDRLFAGAKEVDVLDAYKDKYNIPLFERSIDFGMFWFLTIPFFHLLKLIHGMVGNFGISILLMTVLVKGAFFPLANKSYKAMSKMKKLQPEIKKLQERHGEDKMRLQQEMMALYKREKVNPVSGCLPVIIQIPVFFALYKVLFVTIEMRHAPFFGWIHDLSAPDPTTIFNLFGLIPWTPPSFLMLGLWPLIMGVTMWLQQKLNPQPADPVQAKMFMILPVVFTFLLSSFPAGLVIYWAWSNVLSIAQQSLIMKRMGVKP